MFKTKLFLIIGLVACFDQASSLSCKNEKGQNVDWYVLLKPPKQQSENPRISTGGGYGYITNKSPTANWELGNFDISQNESFTGKTFAEVYKNPEKYSYIQYNDAKPEGVGSDSSTYAHAKGALVWDNKDAVWIVHSTPKFLPLFHGKKYEFPDTGKIHGQNFLCLTLSARKYVNSVLNHLITMKAQIYGNHISSSLSKPMVGLIQENMNILANVIIKLNFVSVYTRESGSTTKVRTKKGEPDATYWGKELDGQKRLNKVNGTRIKQLTTEIKTKGGESFIAIAKSRKDNVDIWSAIAAPAMKAKEFAVKFWVLLQKSLLSSTCTRDKVYNVEDMDIKLGNLKVDWGKNDHSKWGVCVKEGDGCYCAGDMNRAESQFKRGGGVVCMHNKKVHDTFQSSYTSYTDCNNKTEHVHKA